MELTLDAKDSSPHQQQSPLGVERARCAGREFDRILRPRFFRVAFERELNQPVDQFLVGCLLYTSRCV